jgi:hypothetical protein
MGPKYYHRCLCERHEERHRKRKGTVTSKAEIGVMRPQTTEHLESPESERGQKQILPCSLQKEWIPMDTLISDFM